MFGLGAVTRAAIAPGMSGDTLATVEHLDRALCRPGVDLLVDQGVRHRVEEALNLDVVVDADAREMPLGILEVVLRQPRITGCSIASNSWRRLMPRRRISRLFIRSTATAMAALHSAREKNVTLRRRPTM